MSALPRRGRRRGGWPAASKGRAAEDRRRDALRAAYMDAGIGRNEADAMLRAAEAEDAVTLSAVTERMLAEPSGKKREEIFERYLRLRETTARWIEEGRAADAVAGRD